MTKTETLEAFYREKTGVPVSQFNVFELRNCHGKVSYNRRDYFKISLLKGRHLFHYGNKTLEVNGHALVFFNPDIPYTFEALTDEQDGYFCIFREAYFNDYYRSNIKDLKMFTPGSKPAYILTPEQYDTVSKHFLRMQSELASDYAHKHDLIRNCLVEIIHFALRLSPSETLYQQVDANVRISAVFNELLERQFPVSIEEPVGLRSASDFALKLGVHVNHLNRALRSATGRTTTEHISERLTNEAIALLKHTDWNISEISYSLGFEDPAHFNRFFKKQTEQVPSSFR
jgi:AraC family transcriptional regulator, transcriptional activator of pobA